MRCINCPLFTTIHCLSCSLPFCISHTLPHLKTHSSIAVDNKPVHCRKCYETDVHKICIKEKKYKCMECIKECERKKVNSIEPTKKSKKNKKSPKYLPILTNTLNLHSTACTQLTYTYETYKQIYNELIEIEKEQEKKIKEDQAIQQPIIEWKNDYALIKIEDRYKISIGDEVELYSLKETNKQTIAKGIISQYDEDIIKIKFNRIPSKDELKNIHLLEFNFKNICYDRMKRGIKNMNKINKDIVDIIYSGKKKNDTEYKDSSTYKIIYNKESKSNGLKDNNTYNLSDATINTNTFNNIYLIHNTLNTSQIEAINLVLRNNLSIIQGPPGSGKTLTCVNIIYNLIKYKKNKEKILVVSTSNIAVDNIVKEIKLSNQLLKERFNGNINSLNFFKALRIYSKNRESIDNENDDIALHTLISKTNDYALARDRIISANDIVLCTCATAGSSYLRKYSFSYVIADESVQAVEPLLMTSLSNKCKKLILIGDDKQLGPTILSEEARRKGYGISLFERLSRLGVMVHILHTQYRMDPIISEIISNRYYKGCLITSNDYINEIIIRNKKYLDGTNNLINLLPTFFFHVKGKEERLGTSYMNKEESIKIVEIVKQLIKYEIKEEDIGIITMYEAQRKDIVKRLKKSGFNKNSKTENTTNTTITVNNIDGYQGREKNIILISLTCSNQPFIRNKRRMNVAMSRGKHGMILVGNADEMEDKEWKRTTEWYKERKKMVEGEPDDVKVKNENREIVFDLKNLLDEIE